MRQLLIITAGLIFIASLIANIIARKIFSTKNDPTLDDYYYEFEDQHPKIQKLNYWTKLTFSAMIISALLIFAMAVL